MLRGVPDCMGKDEVKRCHGHWSACFGPILVLGHACAAALKGEGDPVMGMALLGKPVSGDVAGDRLWSHRPARSLPNLRQSYCSLQAVSRRSTAYDPFKQVYTEPVESPDRRPDEVSVPHTFHDCHHDHTSRIIGPLLDEPFSDR